MDFNLVWKAILILVFGIILIRISGRKSISQMTISETIIMISIGTLLVQPIATKGIWSVAAILIITLIAIEFIQMKWDVTETILTGRSKIVVENGKLNEKNLSKLRLSVDKLEIRLRQNGIENISDLQWATIEPSGQLGYSFVEKKKFATKEDVDTIQRTLDTLVMQLDPQIKVERVKESEVSEANIFSEVNRRHTDEEEEHLQ